MTPDEERRRERERRLVEGAYVRARSDLAGDLRSLADDFVEQIAALRREVRMALGLRPPRERAGQAQGGSPVRPGLGRPIRKIRTATPFARKEQFLALPGGRE